jgi:methyl-accepting chemotaxis protein
MDKVVQNNAAASEEAAGASEELSAQAESLMTVVAELVRLVGGGSGGNEQAGHQRHGRSQPRVQEAGNRRRELPAPTKGHSVVRPEEVIPLDSDDLDSF